MRAPLPKGQHRRKPVRKRRATPRRSGRQRDPEYMDRVRMLPCSARHLSLCQGPIEADHAGRRPMGRKCSDRECIPLCSMHHRDRTDFAGPFKFWSHNDMRYWLDGQIAATQTWLAREP